MIRRGSSVRTAAGLASVVLALCAGQATAQDAIDGDPLRVFDECEAAAIAARRAGGAAAEIRAAYRAALDAFVAIPPDSPGYPERIARGAAVAESAGDPALAAELWAERLQAAPADPTAVAGRLRSLLASAGGEVALDEALRRRASCPRGVRAFVVDARSLADGALFAAAYARLRRGDVEAGLFPLEVAAEDVGAPLDLVNLALAMRCLGRVDEALRLYDRALNAAADDTITWSDRGLCLLAADRPAEAIASFWRSVAVEATPGDGPGWTNLALLARNPPRAEPTVAGTKPLPELEDALRKVLRARPTQELCRRMMVDLAVPHR